MELRHISRVCGNRIHEKGVTHKYVLLKEWMLKPLYAQYLVGIPEPVFKMPGIVSELTNSTTQVTTPFVPLSFTSRIRLVLEPCNEPGFEYQLVIRKAP